MHLLQSVYVKHLTLLFVFANQYNNLESLIFKTEISRYPISFLTVTVIIVTF